MLFQGTRFILICVTSGSALPSSVRSFDCHVITSGPFRMMLFVAARCALRVRATQLGIAHHSRIRSTSPECNHFLFSRSRSLGRGTRRGSASLFERCKETSKKACVKTSVLFWPPRGRCRALIIGFSFAMAISRHERRKNYEEAQANAIGAEYVLPGQLPVA